MKRIVKVTVEKVALALITSGIDFFNSPFDLPAVVRMNSGDLDANGREVRKDFPPISTKDVLQNLGGVVKLPNRWTFILPKKEQVFRYVRTERDWFIAEHNRVGNRVRNSKGHFVRVSEFTGKIETCNKLLDFLNGKEVYPLSQIVNN